MKRLILSILVLAAAQVSTSTAKTISLDGKWKFAVDTAGVYSIHNVHETADWRDAVVPMSWQAQFPDLRRYQGVAWYMKDFALPAIRKGHAVVIHFGAVDYLAKVYVNGQFAGEHEGGYLPFDLDITSLVRRGNNEVVVRVMDPSTSPGGTEGIRYSEIPHGKQSWYVQTSGIWQSVEVSVKPAVYFKEVHVTAAMDGQFSIDAKLSGKLSGERERRFAALILDPGMKEVLLLSRQAEKGKDTIHVESALQDPLLWSPDSPNLYTVKVILSDGDTATERFGFRSFGTRDGKFYLNGKPIYIMAALDQDFYPGTVYTPPSKEFIVDEMKKAKMLGLNMLRCHIKVPDPRYLEAADETGMLIWYEIPNWDHFTPVSARRGLETFDGMLRRDWNHPSIVMISLINESWGINLRDSTERLWLRNAYDYAKSRAVGRLIEDNSPCCDNFHVKSDVADWHTYWAIPENRENFRETVEQVASRPKWLFSPYGDAEAKGDEPLMISEFGNWGLPQLPADIPWWLKKPFGSGEVEPDGILERFHEYKLDESYGTYDSLAVESERAQFDALKYEIETIRLQSPIQGYVITEFTDINWECNGLMDMWRHPKVYSRELADIQGQDVLIPRSDKYNYVAGENAVIRLWVSHYSGRNLDGGSVVWTDSNGGEGKGSLPAVSNAGVTEIAPVQLRMSDVKSPAELRINFTLNDSTGNPVCRNFLNVFVYPHHPLSGLNLEAYSPDSSIRRIVDETGTSLKSGGRKVLVSDVLDSGLIGRVKSGAQAVCFVNDSTRLPSSFPFRVGVRDTGGYDGNWASNMNWIRKDREPFRDFNFGGHLGFETAEVPPRVILVGIPQKDYGDVLAGMYIGWIHLDAAYILQMRIGQGKLVLCTLPVTAAFSRDPYSRALISRLVKYVSGPECDPGLGVSY